MRASGVLPASDAGRWGGIDSVANGARTLSANTCADSDAWALPRRVVASRQRMSRLQVDNPIEAPWRGASNAQEDPDATPQPDEPAPTDTTTPLEIDIASDDLAGHSASGCHECCGIEPDARDHARPRNPPGSCRVRRFAPPFRPPKQSCTATRGTDPVPQRLRSGVCSEHARTAVRSFSERRRSAGWGCSITSRARAPPATRPPRAVAAPRPTSPTRGRRRSAPTPNRIRASTDIPWLPPRSPSSSARAHDWQDEVVPKRRQHGGGSVETLRHRGSTLSHHAGRNRECAMRPPGGRLSAELRHPRTAKYIDGDLVPVTGKSPDSGHPLLSH